ncbi:MAG: hypothetical protein PHU93_05115 [Candidatus Gracilibacteria bacterium]|nr:hypothetical protein [Candidatus Gracilibacteria bacterium]
MNIPHFIPKPELFSTIQDKGVLHLLSNFTDIFSHGALSHVDHFVQNLRNSRQPQSEDVMHFVQTYLAETLEMKTNTNVSVGNEVGLVFALLEKYPAMCSKLITPPIAREVEQLDTRTKLELLHAGYYEHFNQEFEGQRVFNGTKHYRMFGNLHGDTMLESFEFDRQPARTFDVGELEISNINTTSLARIRLYQQTVSLMKAWCYFYRKSNGSMEALTSFVNKLESISTNPLVEHIDPNVVIDIQENIIENTIGFYDVTENYEATDLYLYSGPWDMNHPQAFLYNRHTLTFAVQDPLGEIIFNIGKEYRKYRKIFDIPKEDALGILQLICQIPSKSELINRQILKAFIAHHHPHELQAKK